MSCCSSSLATTTSPTFSPGPMPPATPVMTMALAPKRSISSAVVVAAAALPMPESTATTAWPCRCPRQKLRPATSVRCSSGSSASTASSSSGSALISASVMRAGSLVAQLAAQDLAHRRLGQLGAELDHARLLVAGEPAAAELAHLLLGERRVLLHDDQLDGLAGFFVGHADHRALQHTLEFGDHVLDLVRVHVETADQHHVLLAVHHPEVAALVHDPDVAALEVAVGGHDL